MSVAFPDIVESDRRNVDKCEGQVRGFLLDVGLMMGWDIALVKNEKVIFCARRRVAVARNGLIAANQ